MSILSSLPIDPYILAAGAGLVGGASMLYHSSREDNERDWLTYRGAKKKHKLVANEATGIVLGYHANGKLLSDASKKHIIIDGPTESGKTAGSILMTLLCNIRYAIILSDQSGDLWDLTSGIRSTYGPIFRIDPSEPNSSTYNPFDDILFSDNMYAELQRFFKTLIVGDGPSKAKDPHWEQKATELAPAVAMHLLLGPDNDQKNIGSVLRFIRRGPVAFEEMVRCARHPICVELASTMLTDMPEEGSPYRNSVMQSITAPLSLWNDINVDRITRSSSFLMDDLMTHDEPITVYMTAPGSDIDRLLPLYRAIRDMSKAHLLYRSNVTLRGNKKIRGVLQIVDECQNEQPPQLNKRLEVCRKYGERWMLGWQSLDAAEQLYGKSFLGLAKLKLSYRPTVGDPVVKRLSAMSGFYEEKEVNETQKKDHGFWVSNTRNVKKEWKPRLEAHDFEQWPEFGRALFTHPGKPAVLNVTDGKVDHNFSKYILPAYILRPNNPIVSPWYNDIPEPVHAPEEEPDIEFQDEFEVSGAIQYDDNEVIV